MGLNTKQASQNSLWMLLGEKGNLFPSRKETGTVSINHPGRGNKEGSGKGGCYWERLSFYSASVAFAGLKIALLYVSIYLGRTSANTLNFGAKDREKKICSYIFSTNKWSECCVSL